MTNLEKALQYFPKAKFDENDNYQLNKEWEIEYLTEGSQIPEHFVVNHYYFDRDVGYVSDTEVFSGNFDECLTFVLKEEGRQP